MIIIKDIFINRQFMPNNLVSNILEEYKFIYIECAGFFIFDNYWKRASDSYVKSIICEYLGDSVRSGYINEGIELLKCNKILDSEKLNNNRNRIVLNNGTLDLTNWAAIKFYKNTYFSEDYSTIKIDITYNENAECPEFINYLESTFQNDDKLIQTVQEMLGYCLTPSNKFQKAFILLGEGSNGKSVLLDVFNMLVSDNNVSSVSLTDFSKSFSRAKLLNKLVNLSGEFEGNIQNSEYFKKIVSGDLIDAEFKYRTPFEFKPFCKIIAATNNFPYVKDKSHGFYRRLLIIPFKKIFTQEEQDSELTLKLKNEKDGILQFALRGLKLLNENNGFTISDASLQAEHMLQVENNNVLAFSDEYLVIDCNSYEKTDDVYICYLNYCEESGFRPFGKPSFGKNLNRIIDLEKGKKRVDGKLTPVYNKIKMKRAN